MCYLPVEDCKKLLSYLSLQEEYFLHLTANLHGFHFEFAGFFVNCVAFFTLTNFFFPQQIDRQVITMRCVIKVL